MQLRKFDFPRKILGDIADRTDPAQRQCPLRPLRQLARFLDLHLLFPSLFQLLLLLSTLR
jgi:hypothetical protein